MQPAEGTAVLQVAKAYGLMSCQQRVLLLQALYTTSGISSHTAAFKAAAGAFRSGTQLSKHTAAALMPVVPGCLLEQLVLQAAAGATGVQLQGRGGRQVMMLAVMQARAALDALVRSGFGALHSPVLL